MLKSYLKTALRSLIRHKAFSLINILGFAFSISICMMIILFIMKEHSYDRFYKNSDNIYKLISSEDNSSQIDYRLKTALVNNFPEIKNGCISQVIQSQLEVAYNGKICFSDNIMSADNDYFKVFNFSFLSGNASSPFLDKNSVVLTESIAHKLFGSNNPVGKEIVLKLLLKGDTRLTVTGVIKDFPDNSSNSANLIVNGDNDTFKFNFSCANNEDSGTYRYLFNSYLLFKENTNIKQTVDKINNHSEIMYPFEKRIGVISLKDIYLYDNTSGSCNKKGSPALLNILSSIALIILTLAVINYVNLTVAQQNRRNKETGIRKTIGAGRKSIIAGFLIESVLVTFIAFILALLIVELALPYFSGILDSRLSIQILEEFPVNIILIISIFTIGIISGFGPALRLSSFNPVKIFNRNAIFSSRKGYTRNVLTVFQFVVSIALIFCLIVIQKQIAFVKHSDLGFNKEQLLRLDVDFVLQEKVPALISELRQNSNIESISGSFGSPGKINMSMGSGIPGKDQHIRCIFADSAFINTFKMQLFLGRTILPGDDGKVCMINESAYKYFGWKDLINKRYNNGRKGGFEVIGVVRDFHFSSLHETIEPACIMFDHDAPNNIISLRMKTGALPETMDYINTTWKKNVPDYPIKYQFYDDFFNAMYQKEEKFAKAIGLFAILAISISCMGILGLVIFASERRAKEIGIRKVHGAKVSELVFMLNKDFLKWVVLASVVALPLGGYAMNKWLRDFSYKTEIDWWVFALSVLLSLLVALLTISWQTWRTVRKNPIEVLRYE